ncbi:hypothetical protein [Ilumatobacter sp.]|uniref:hypothetical protein n=1 Tax=Ilumatobacter sp. TaxID=1967498 RepID=UPI00262F543F|nr:hypothetical protein [Ilumatobacter sp.]
MAARRGSGQMSNEQKRAMERGRAEGRTVRLYLDAIRALKPKRGRKRTAASITKRLETIERDLPAADAIRQLALVQERRDLTEELASMEVGADLTALEDDFVAVAKAYGERKGIAYASWREVGVPAAVLRRAGISRGRRTDPS